MRIVHQPGNDELRQPPRYEGALPSTRTIEGRSSLLDETTFCDLSQFDVPLADHREQLRDRALRFAQAFGHTAQPLIASELLSPELVTAIPGDIEPHQQRGILSVLGLCCRDLAVSQDIHRGFFRLTPAVGQTVMRQLAEEPAGIPRLLASDVRNDSPPYDKQYAQYIAAASTLESVFARIQAAKYVPQDPAEARYNLSQPRDSTDGRTFRYAALKQQIVDPSYYFHPTYEQTVQPLESPQQWYGMVRHMLVGFYEPSGNDHMFLYANTPRRPNAVAGAKGDFSACRPGNYLYHDLQVLYWQSHKTAAQGHSWIADMPVELVLDYAIANYLSGMEIDMTRLSAQTASVASSFSGPSISGYCRQQELGFPLRKVNRVIPHRYSAKGAGPLRRWRSQDYLTELVDIALKLDEIAAVAGRTEKLDQSLLQRLLQAVHCISPAAARQIEHISRIMRQDAVPALTGLYSLYDRPIS